MHAYTLTSDFTGSAFFIPASVSFFKGKFESSCVAVAERRDGMLVDLGRNAV